MEGCVFVSKAYSASWLLEVMNISKLFDKLVMDFVGYWSWSTEIIFTTFFDTISTFHQSRHSGRFRAESVHTETAVERCWSRTRKTEKRKAKGLSLPSNTISAFAILCRCPIKWHHLHMAGLPKEVKPSLNCPLYCFLGSLVCFFSSILFYFYFKILISRIFELWLDSHLIFAAD